MRWGFDRGVRNPEGLSSYQSAKYVQNRKERDKKDRYSKNDLQDRAFGLMSFFQRNRSDVFLQDRCDLTFPLDHRDFFRGEQYTAVLYGV
jgi:hypothetical protein